MEFFKIFTRSDLTLKKCCNRVLLHFIFIFYFLQVWGMQKGFLWVNKLSYTVFRDVFGGLMREDAANAHFLSFLWCSLLWRQELCSFCLLTFVKFTDLFQTQHCLFMWISTTFLTLPWYETTALSRTAVTEELLCQNISGFFLFLSSFQFAR